jgi:hypothetical protein
VNTATDPNNKQATAFHPLCKLLPSPSNQSTFVLITATLFIDNKPSSPLVLVHLRGFHPIRHSVPHPPAHPTSTRDFREIKQSISIVTQVDSRQLTIASPHINTTISFQGHLRPTKLTVQSQSPAESPNPMQQQYIRDKAKARKSEHSNTLNKYIIHAIHAILNVCLSSWPTVLTTIHAILLSTVPSRQNHGMHPCTG